MAKTPKQLVNKIKQAQKRVNQAVSGKKVLVRKPDAKPVFKPQSKAAQIRQRKEFLSLKDMMRETTTRTRQLMRQGNVSVVQIKKTRSGGAILCETVTQKPAGLNTRYKQLIQNLDSETDNFGDSTWIKAECTCPRYKFAHDYALHQKNASDLRFSIDEPPDITNPDPRNLGVCKHLYRCLQSVIAKGW